MKENKLRIIDKLNHIKNLFQLGKIDNNLDEEEIKIITTIARAHGLSYQDISYITNHSDKIPFSVPERYTDRLAALYDLVLLMIADLKVTKKEKAFCKTIAKKYEFNEQIIDQLIEDIFQYATEGKPCKEVVEYLIKYTHPKENLN